MHTQTYHVFHRSDQQKAEDSIGSTQLTSYIVVGNIMVGMSFLVSTFIMFLVKERAAKAKHIQFVSGVNAVNYWFSTFAWDFINYSISALACLPILYAFDIPGISDNLG